VAAAAGGAGGGSEAAFAPADSSHLSWQGEEGQIGPSGLNSSEGPKVSAGCCVPWFPTSCLGPHAEGQGCGHPARDLQPGSQHPGDGIAMPPPGRDPTLSIPHPVRGIPMPTVANVVVAGGVPGGLSGVEGLGETCGVAKNDCVSLCVDLREAEDLMARREPQDRGEPG